MRIFYRFAFALVVTASIPMILGNPVIAADLSAQLHGEAAGFRLGISVAYPPREAMLARTIRAILAPAR